MQTVSESRVHPYIKVALWYLGYSLFVGALLSRAFHSNGPKLIDAPLVFSLIAGPSVALSTTHGAEIYLLATLICLPCAWGIVLLKPPLARGLCAAIFLLVWCGLGIFMH